MNSEINQDLTIELKSQGRNTIPVIGSGNIVTIHGNNGVGKSMAATLLEIASGNYIFENETRFQKLANVIESCEVHFKNKGNLLFRVILKPHLWNFDKNLNRVNPLTLGKFFKGEQKRENEIDFDEFRQKINIRTIRGSESLQQQIIFFKDVFVAKINQKLKKLEKKIDYLENYQERLNKNKENVKFRAISIINPDTNTKKNPDMLSFSASPICYKKVQIGDILDTHNSHDKIKITEEILISIMQYKEEFNKDAIKRTKKTGKNMITGKYIDWIKKKDARLFKKYFNNFSWY